MGIGSLTVIMSANKSKMTQKSAKAGRCVKIFFTDFEKSIPISYISDPYNFVSKLCRSKVFAQLTFKLGFLYCVDLFDGFGVSIFADPLNVFSEHPHIYSKGTSFGQDASFEPSTINIGPGVRPVEVRKKKGKGRDRSRIGLKRYSNVI